jgi:metal-dependent amidase/aminoacylase/carboxypeptidase family protein
MPAIEELKAKVQAEIDRRGEDIVRVAQTILQHPEPGFREHKTAKLVGCCEYCV